jgi:hypothetical protein
VCIFCEPEESNPGGRADFLTKLKSYDWWEKGKAADDFYQSLIGYHSFLRFY